ncbi:mitochondrial arginine transporter BAC2-like [Magnolia sinica]|uniref:mitochondrial arginine transporter BAC2-like n=1 Tax=Magnolia sinica TaxID=86752 RepID=UPI002659D0CA|nr:mitochondrial arginine transporter BAC2-like [Magnolia sinica]
MEFWPEFLASNWCKEFIAGGFGGVAGVISGHPLDTLRVHLQQPSNNTSTFRLLRNIVASGGPSALYKGMATPLVSIAFQNAVVFQSYHILSRAFDSGNGMDPPSYKSVTLGGVGAGALQCVVLTPAELLKIRLQLQNRLSDEQGPISVAQTIMRKEGITGLYRGLAITVLRDAPSHGFYFWTYEYTRDLIHPGCRMSGEESLSTMFVAGGLAGVASWLCCYPLDVVKTRLQAQPLSRWDHLPLKYDGIMDCFRKSVQEEGHTVLWRGLGTTVARSFIVNGAVFATYEIALQCLGSDCRREGANGIMATK